MYDFSQKEFSFIEDLKQELKILRLITLPEFFTFGFITCKANGNSYLLVAGITYFLSIEKEDIYKYLYLLLVGAPLFLGFEIEEFSYSSTRDEVTHNGKLFNLYQLDHVKELTEIFKRTTFVFKD
jgi:hypothetical protein|nr:MAG TPA: hypothetical protein [Caudoviricetes sp.]